MGKVAILRKGKRDITEILSNLSKEVNLNNVGAIVIFIGRVREKARKSGNVQKLFYECAEEAAIKELNDIRKFILSKYEIKDILIYHFIGDLEPGEHTIYIIVTSSHREPAFKAAEEALELVKTRVPIWKKEITDKDEYWVSGDEILE